MTCGFDDLGPIPFPFCLFFWFPFLPFPFLATFFFGVPVLPFLPLTFSTLGLSLLISSPFPLRSWLLSTLSSSFLCEGLPFHLLLRFPIPFPILAISSHSNAPSFLSYSTINVLFQVLAENISKREHPSVALPSHRTDRYSRCWLRTLSQEEHPSVALSSKKCLVNSLEFTF